MTKRSTTKHPRIEQLKAGLRSIAKLGGNLPDASLTDRTGPNDAAHRGLMYCQARHIARCVLAEIDLDSTEEQAREGIKRIMEEHDASR